MKYFNILCFLAILVLDMCLAMEEIAVESNGLAEKKIEKRGVFGFGYGNHGGYYGGVGGYGFGRGGGSYGNGVGHTYPFQGGFSSHLPYYSGYRGGFYH